METIDPTIKNLVSAIGRAETGAPSTEAYTKPGKSGEFGRYQFMPETWKQWAPESGVDINDTSIAAQNKVAYNKVKEWKDKGMTPAMIASKWNSGSETKYKEGWKGTATLADGTKVDYDTPAYTKKVSDYYNELKGGQSQTSSQSTTKTFDDIPDTSTSSDNLKAGNPTTLGNTSIGNTVANLTPGSKMAQGAGYGLAAATGSQKGLIEANNNNIDIYGKLLKQIKDNKAKGKDATRLEKYMKDLGVDIEKYGNQVSDVGTGGITNKQVLKSAGSLAAVPVLAYAGGTISGLLKAKSALTNPTIKGILEQSIGKGETIANLSRQEAINGLGNALKEMSVSQAGGKTEQLILKALQELNPTLVEKKSIISKLIKMGWDTTKAYALFNLLGDKVGGVVNKIIP